MDAPYILRKKSGKVGETMLSTFRISHRDENIEKLFGLRSGFDVTSEDSFNNYFIILTYASLGWGKKSDFQPLSVS